MQRSSDTTLAVLLFRPSEVPERALSRGFAVALAGWEVPAPRLGLAALPGLPGWSVAFYTYSHERYEPCAFPDGSFHGTPEAGLEIGALYLQ